MKIEDNEKEKEAMAAFHRGDRAAGLALQEEFAARFREVYAKRDHHVEALSAVVLRIVAGDAVSPLALSSRIWMSLPAVREVFFLHYPWARSRTPARRCFSSSGRSTTS